jgi:hypothetical protein
MATIVERTVSSTFAGLGTQIGLSYGIILATVIGFELIRRNKARQHLFTPRTHLTK